MTLSEYESLVNHLHTPSQRVLILEELLHPHDPEPVKNWKRKRFGATDAGNYVWRLHQIDPTLGLEAIKTAGELAVRIQKRAGIPEKSLQWFVRESEDLITRYQQRSTSEFAGEECIQRCLNFLNYFPRRGANEYIPANQFLKRWWNRLQCRLAFLLHNCQLEAEKVDLFEDLD